MLLLEELLWKSQKWDPLHECNPFGATELISDEEAGASTAATQHQLVPALALS